MHNPLLDTNVYVRTWYDIAEELQDRIAWVARKGRGPEAFKWLNVLDLIDDEAAAYWRERGMRIYNGEQVEVAQHTYRTPTEYPQVGVGELAHKPQSNAVDNEFASISLI